MADYSDILALQAQKILVLSQGNVIDRIQSLGSTGELPSEEIKELGNPAIVAVVKDIPEVAVDIEAYDTNCELMTLLQGGDPHAATPPTSFDITADAFRKVNFLYPVKRETTTTVLKTCGIGAAQVTSIGYGYTADGMGTETMSFAADNKFWANNSAAYEGFTQSATPVTTFDLDVATYGGTIEWKTDQYTFIVAVNGIRQTEGTSAQVGTGDADYYIDVGAGGGGADVLTFGTAPAIGAYIDIIYPCVTTQVFGSGVHEGSAIYPGAIKGKNIRVEINAGKIFRAQSCNISIDFPATVIKELGSVTSPGTIVDIPSVTGDISVLDRDGDLFAKMCGQASLEAAKGLSIEDFVDTLPVEIKLYDPDDNATVLKTIYLPKISITTEGITGRVGEQLTQTFGFKLAAGEIATVYRGSKP